VILFSYTRCLRSTLLVGRLLNSRGRVATGIGPPYPATPLESVFRSGPLSDLRDRYESRAVQKMNGIMQDIGRGDTPLDSRPVHTFRRLFYGRIDPRCYATR